MTGLCRSPLDLPGITSSNIQLYSLSFLFVCLCSIMLQCGNDLEQHAVVLRASIIWSIRSPWLVLHRLRHWQRDMKLNASLTFACSVFLLLLLTHLISVPVFPNTLNLDVVIPKKYLSVYTLYNLKHPLSTFDL